MQDSWDLKRVAALPRRPVAVDEDLLRQLSTFVGGELRPAQARALYELHDFGGLLAPMKVGSGKTLVTLLAPTLLGSVRPLLIVPAKLRDKTTAEAKAYRKKGWRIGIMPVIESYERLGRASAEDFLETYNPDLIIADEAHRLKNGRAAVTRRVMRFLADHPGAKFAALSGTLMSRSIRDFAHLSKRALGDLSPAPHVANVVEEWGLALDEKVETFMRLEAGALLPALGCMTVPDSKAARTTRARELFKYRLLETAGVVAAEGAGCTASLTLDAHFYEESEQIAEAFRKLRSTWETPNGEAIVDASALWRHARELACGFYYRWQTPAPEEWLDARRAWAGTARYLLAHNQRNIDSELVLVRAVDAGYYPEATAVLERWRTVRDTFRPVTVAEWIDPLPLLRAARALDKGTLIWVEHVAVGELLSRELGVPFFRQQGLDANGRAIESHDGGTCVASIASCGEGRNLQAWSKSFVTSVPPTGTVVEQLLGRTHREGQEADEVEATFGFGCAEALLGFWQAVMDCTTVNAMTGGEQKVLLADVQVPRESPRRGAAWKR